VVLVIIKFYNNLQQFQYTYLNILKYLFKQLSLFYYIKMSKRYKEDDDLIIDDVFEKKSKAKSRGKSRSNNDEEKSIFIKEFDMNLMSPNSIDSKNGTKVVVIGKPGTGDWICL